MSDDNKLLNLDELFGQARKVKVRFQEKDYEFLRMEGISPRQATQFNKLQMQASRLQNGMKNSQDITEEQGVEIDKIFDRMIQMLCPDFPVDRLPFMGKMRVIQFYMEETQGKKKTEAELKKLRKPTGAKSSVS